MILGRRAWTCPAPGILGRFEIREGIMSRSGVVTRFAPSPTGFLHIGGARTALFNWLYARGRGGKFLLRIEDTDRLRSNTEATGAILRGLEWLGLDCDGDPVFQSANHERHASVAHALLDQGAAYKCFCGQDEIDKIRWLSKKEGKEALFQSPWRDASPEKHPGGPYVIRLRSPKEGETLVEDMVHGQSSWRNGTFEDLVLLRSDGTPTYMLAVVVDDHDMGVTHVIRGDDHAQNAVKQTYIYEAMDWPVPRFAHIPLIHGADGSKMSKRHGAVEMDAYVKEGYIAEAVRNYLARLGWSHGDDEFFSTKQAIEWFDLGGVRRSPARFDSKKLEKLSGLHIAACGDSHLVSQVEGYLKFCGKDGLDPAKREILLSAMDSLKSRSKTLREIYDNAKFLLEGWPFPAQEKALELLRSPESREVLDALTPSLKTVTWDRDSLTSALADFAERRNLKFGAVALPLRAALTRQDKSPGAVDAMLLLGKDDSLARLGDLPSP